MQEQDPKKIKDAVKDQFSRNAEKYVTSETHAKGDDLTLMLEWLQPQPDWTVLDIATGGGHVTKNLAPHVAHVFATDLTREMLATAQKHLAPTCPNVWYVVADAEGLPFLDGTFDLVTCRIAAHHFPNPKEFVRETARVLKPGGKFLFIDNVVPADDQLDQFVNTLEYIRDESHGRCHRTEEWTAWANDAGLQIVNSRLRKKTFEFPTWVRRTTKFEEQVTRVEQHILQADQRMQEYCGLTMKDGQISSIHIDEWMVMFEA